MNKALPSLRAALALSVSLAPGLALAHGGEHHLSAHEVLRWWTWDPLVLLSVGLSSWLYARGTRRLWRRAGVGRGVRPWEVACFVGGTLAIGVALISPLDALSAILFSAHMTQHELLMVVAAPLLVLGRPVIPWLWAIPPAWREGLGRFSQRPGVSRTWHAITNPFAVLVAHGLARWGWHIPVLFEAALRNDGIHAVQHLMFFLTAALLWWALIHGRYGRMGYGVAVLYTFITATHTGVLGALITFARGVWYPLYEERGSAWSVSALHDQQRAGLIMWIPAGLVFLVAALALFAAWLGEAERRVGYTRTEALLALGDEAGEDDPPLSRSEP